MDYVKRVLWRLSEIILDGEPINVGTSKSIVDLASMLESESHVPFPKVTPIPTGVALCFEHGYRTAGIKVDAAAIKVTLYEKGVLDVSFNVTHERPWFAARAVSGFIAGEYPRRPDQIARGDGSDRRTESARTRHATGADAGLCRAK